MRRGCDEIDQSHRETFRLEPRCTLISGPILPPRAGHSKALLVSAFSLPAFFADEEPMDDGTEIKGGCRYVASTGCLLGLGALLIVILLIMAVLTLFGAGLYSALDWVWSLL